MPKSRQTNGGRRNDPDQNAIRRCHPCRHLITCDCGTRKCPSIGKVIGFSMIM